MTELATAVNQQIRLAARPVGSPKDSDWQFTEEAVVQPGDGGVLVRTLYLSLDPGGSRSSSSGLGRARWAGMGSFSGGQ